MLRTWKPFKAGGIQNTKRTYMSLFINLILVSRMASICFKIECIMKMF